jgi:dihydrofolate synthase/folylpolyglutamate synthase
MDYEGATDYLFHLQRFGIKLGLENVTALLERLGNPQGAFPAVHVAGTNGKGSVCAFLDAVLREAGYRVGLYTSPHLVKFNERIRVDGEPISDARIVELTEILRTHAEAMAAESPANQPTFFEVTTAMAFQEFADRAVDVAVLEVGMGGRLDATNVVTPEVVCITHIGLEHTEYLGKTVDRIAGEKAGIIKEGVPVVAADGPYIGVIEEACSRLSAPLTVVGRDIVFRREPHGPEGQAIQVNAESKWNLRTRLLGTYQGENAAITVGAAEALMRAGWKIPEKAVTAGILKARWPARLQVISKHPTVVMDCTHTVDGARELTRSLAENFCPERTMMVIGVLSDKDCHGMARELAPAADVFHVTRAKSERALPAQDLAEAFHAEGREVQVHGSVPAAVSEAMASAGSRDLVVITGSLYTAGEAMEHLGVEP